MKRFIACLLCLAMIMPLLPVQVIQAMAAEQQPYTIDDGYIQVQVSKQNGGFIVKTVEGDLLKKSDNNKKLLFHNGEYDTSFVSYRVDYDDGTIADYLFGGKYGDSNDPSHKGVTVTQAQTDGDIHASWSVGELVFTQSISLANEQSGEHGMVSIQLAAQNKSGSPVKIKARLLLDTCLGEQDFGYYQLTKDSDSQVIRSEKIIEAEAIPLSFYAMDNPHNPGVVAYSVNSPSAMPYQIAFGHWNNLASSLFDFGPQGSLDYTSPYNDYFTTDSAYALYYDLGNVANNGAAGLTTHYGVYSRHKVPAANSVAVDAVVPLRLELDNDKENYIRLTTVGIADFLADVTFENYASATAKPLSNVVLSVQTTANVRPLSDSGQAIEGLDFGSFEPLNITYADVQIGKPITKTFYFEAQLSNEAAYERITIGVYDVSSTGGQISANHLLGEKVVYILLPGSDGSIPQVNFASMTPDIIYYSGTRHLYATVTNEAMLVDRGNWSLKAYTIGEITAQDIPHDLISIKDGVMDIALTNDIKLAPGTWYLQLEWTDAAVQNNFVPSQYQKQTGPQLRFVVSEDPKYKNDSYGVLCVVEYNKDHKPTTRSETFGGASAYRIESFKDESDFAAFKDNTDNYVEILLVFRGEFTADKYVKDQDDHKEYTYYRAVSTKSLDNDTREYKVDNTITINGCMDFEGGTMLVYYENYNIPDQYKKATINVDFDGELLTSDARTSIWKGEALLTKISQGESFSLRPYDKNGNREDDFNDSTIRLVWPSVYGAGQTLAGMVFKLAYGELGVMYDDEGAEMGRVMSFSASLSLSFLKAVPGQEEKTTYWTKMQDLYKYYKEGSEWRKFFYSADDVNKLWDFDDVDEEKPKQKGVTAAVMVPDVLFGCGQGFVGVHFKVGIGVQNMIDGLPEISGQLEVNTINDWSFGFEGSMELATMTMEARLSFKSRNNIPVPDEIYFFVGGFKPGINIDGGGVVWLTGGGGGISNLYDTIFLTQSVPPLKLLLSATFSIIQIMDGRADLALGLTGISLKASDLKIPGDFEVVKQVYLGLDWYPDLNLQASISVNFFQGVIKGGGYIVLFSKEYSDFFFEIYLHAMLGIPESVPVVGGMTLLGVDLGANNDKIWGGFKVLGIGYGVTYYWGQDGVDFTTGGQMAQPTYPSLLGQDDIPVYYDEEREQTLYARFGTNITPIGSAEIVESAHAPRLMAAELGTDPDKNLHRFNLGAYDDNNNAALVQISYAATSLQDAKTKAAAFRVNDTEDLNGINFPLVFYDGSNADTANTNVTYNVTSKQAACSFTVTEPTHYGKDWYISTGTIASSVMLYNVGLLPQVTKVSGIESSGEVTLNWQGAALGDLDRLSFYLTESNDKGDLKKLESAEEEDFEISETAEGGIVLAVLNKADDIERQTAIVTIPAATPSGDYYIRAVYSKEDQVNGMIFSEETISYSNSNGPGACTVTGLQPAGNLEYRLSLASGINTDGYQVTIYNPDGTPTDVASLTYPRAESGETVFNIGGSYEYEGKSYGLTGGQSYYAGVTPYKLLGDDTVVYGKEVRRGPVLLPHPSTPTVDIAADKTAKIITTAARHPNQSSKERRIYRDNEVTITATISEVSTGSWSLDGGWNLDDNLFIDREDEHVTPRGDFAGMKKVVIPLRNMAEGDHTLTIWGSSDSQGDRFKYDYDFTVDTTPPRLMLTSPLNGSFFGKDGSLTVSGITDGDAYFTIKSGGTVIFEEKTVSSLGGAIGTDGIFEFTTQIPDPHSASRRDLLISVSDQVGNTLSQHVWVSHGGLADLQELKILVDEAIMDNGNIPTNMPEDQSRQLALLGVTGSGQSFRLTNESNVSWQCQAAEGSAQVDEDGILTFSPDAKGLLVGRLEVTTGAYRTAALSLGSEVAKGAVSVTSTIGGTVTGGGQYEPGAQVTLTASPHSGYSFAGWTIIGASVANGELSTVKFTMPVGRTVSAHATFRANTWDDGSSPHNPDPTDPKPDVPDTPGTDPDAPGINSVTAKMGELVRVEIPAGVNPNTFVAYYLNEAGRKIFVTLSSPIAGKLCFKAPLNATYYFEDNKMTFKDTVKHWAESVINFMTARGLFRGVGNDQFAPNQPMTRAMFVTVLHRLAGEPKAKQPSTFLDVKAGAWYSAPVAWGQESGIAGGMGDGTFAPDQELTREQMCAFIVRFIRMNGIDLPATVDSVPFADAAAISPWAAKDVAYCQTRGLVGGYPDKKFLPQGKATRAENCAVLMRLINTIVRAAFK